MIQSRVGKVLAYSRLTTALKYEVISVSQKAGKSVIYSQLVGCKPYKKKAYRSIVQGITCIVNTDPPGSQSFPCGMGDYCGPKFDPELNLSAMNM